MDGRIWTAVERAAHQHRVPIQPVTLTLKVDDPKAAIKELGAIPRAAEIHCLETTMERLETDLPSMRQRANWWSNGDVDALRNAHYPDEEIACLNALFSVPKFRDQFLSARERLTDVWIAAAEGALDRNISTFAVLPIQDLKPDGWLAKLRDGGYRIQEPQ
jgi:hypothetical protein